MIRLYQYIGYKGIDLGVIIRSINIIIALDKNMTIPWIRLLGLVLRVRISKFSDLSNILRISIII